MCGPIYENTPWEDFCELWQDVARRMGKCRERVMPCPETNMCTRECDGAEDHEGKHYRELYSPAAKSIVVEYWHWLP